MRTLIKDIVNKKGEEVILNGWVDTRRDHGKLIFIDLRDRTGICQVVFLPSNAEVYAKAKDLRGEWVIELKGKVNERPKGMINDKLITGTVEIEALGIEILNQAKTLPIAIDKDGMEIGEENRLKYRYVDLRRQRLQKNIRNRHQLNQFIRNFMTDNDFVEIETPILTKSTPEGARDYVVPSRLQIGSFYALPQSPQQYKQLLMVAGFERYFQLARCFRDEDTRGDRQPEFTQLDLEMSFVKREDVMELNEKLLIELVEKLYPEKKIQEKPFPCISYKEAIGKYGTDKPDLRKDKNDSNLLAFCWVIDFPFFEEVKEESSPSLKLRKSTSSSDEQVPALRSSEGAKKWTFTHNPFSAPQREFMEDLLNQRNIAGIITTQYDIALNGWEIGGGSIRNHQPEALEAVFSIMGFTKERIHKNFGHMLEAFSYGTPPHGGIAWGLDRLMMILENEPNIREVITFPKTGDGRDLMMDAPSEIEEKQLKELHIKNVKG